MLGLARNLRPDYRTVFLSFSERGRCRALLDRVRADGFEAIELKTNFPNVFRAASEIAEHLKRVKTDILVSSGYKPDIVGWLAARRANVPIIAVAHGWTGATWKVRLNEALDRRVLRHVDRVVCVSEAQAEKTRRAGVAPERIVVIRNAIETSDEIWRDPADAGRLQSMFQQSPRCIVGAVGRLSPEKGFDVLIDAASLLLRETPDVGFVLFGDGPECEALNDRIVALGLQERFLLAGFRTDVDRFIPHFAAVTLASHTEGLPVVVLEALRAAVPVVATDVGGIPEVVEHGRNGFLVPDSDAPAFARALLDLIRDEDRRRVMGERGRQRILDEFNCKIQSQQYQAVFDSLVGAPSPLAVCF